MGDKAVCTTKIGPGPAGVNLPTLVGFNGHDSTKMRLPAYSMRLALGSSLNCQGGCKNTPGPKYTIPYGQKANGTSIGVAYTLRSKHKNIACDPGCIGPGPGKYSWDINQNRNKAPLWSLRARLEGRGAWSLGPGPKYMLPSLIGPKVPNKLSLPEYSMTGRGKGDGFNSYPGPKYDIGRPDLVKNKAGAYSMLGRPKCLGCEPHCGGPGPANYDIEPAKSRVFRHPPKYSMGIKHTECAGIYRTKYDESEALPPTC